MFCVLQLRKGCFSEMVGSFVVKTLGFRTVLLPLLCYFGSVLVVVLCYSACLGFTAWFVWIYILVRVTPDFASFYINCENQVDLVGSFRPDAKFGKIPLFKLFICIFTLWVCSIVVSFTF